MPIRTFDLGEAADFLKMDPEELRRRARTGQLPGAKAGKRWVFIEEDLDLETLLRPFFDRTKAGADAARSYAEDGAAHASSRRLVTGGERPLSRDLVPRG